MNHDLNEKRCSACKILLSATDFGKDRSQKSGLTSKCKTCLKKTRDLPKNKEYMRLYRSTPEYKEWDKARQASYEYKEKVNKRQKSKEHYDYQAQYRQKPEVKIKNAKRQKERKDSDLNFRIGQILRNRLHSALRGRIKVGSAIEDLGCSVQELKLYLESLFQPGMTWNNWGKGNGKWQVDHKEELRFFDLTNRDQFLKANNYRNLQPMWYQDHIEKTRYNTKQQNRSK